MKLSIYGVVQGVGFRPCVYNIATSMGLKGYVRNNGSNVEVVLDRDPQAFLDRLREELPPLARIDRVERKVREGDAGQFDDFHIDLSRSGERGSVIPADTSVCDNCIRELFSENDRRYLYPFTNCTDCGARYSLIADVPYDREKTSMASFGMCSPCRAEYTDPGNRRFHAQTTSCPDCGPRYTLYDGDGEVVTRDQTEAFREFAGRLDDGQTGVMKSWGGMHICSGLEAVPELRRLYGRPEKPFALMVRDLSTLKRYAVIGEREKELLISRQRPIVLVKKREDVPELLEKASPGLGTVGVMLPYSPAHHMFFRYYGGDLVVATSANLPGEPICIRNRNAFKLGGDCYLLHDRGIVQRVDDSVVRTFGPNRFFIRKSRGFVPDPIEVGYGGTVLSLGAAENVVAAMSRRGKLFLSQYIGDTHHYDTLMFCEDAVEHMIDLLAPDEVDLIARDMHPGYATRSFADAFGERFGCDIVDVQHHRAHVASLALDNGMIDETGDGTDDGLVALSLDGSGYGEDGTMWGGEILLETPGDHRRAGRLEHIPLLGGERAIRDVRRLVFALGELARGGRGYEGWLDEVSFSDPEITNFRKMLGSGARTSSMGRVLDALSSYLNVCQSRTYSGEPAMKLERYLAAGRERYEFEGSRRGSRPAEIRTLPAFRQLFDMKPPREMTFGEKCDIAHSFVSSLTGEMTRLMCEAAADEGIKYVGLTGGVSYNYPITRRVQAAVEEYGGLELLLHDGIPNGDGGISAGQNVIAGKMISDN